jgi:hypothetical protein
MNRAQALVIALAIIGALFLAIVYPPWVRVTPVPAPEDVADTSFIASAEESVGHEGVWLFTVGLVSYPRPPLAPHGFVREMTVRNSQKQGDGFNNPRVQQEGRRPVGYRRDTALLLAECSLIFCVTICVVLLLKTAAPQVSTASTPVSLTSE